MPEVRRAEETATGPAFVWRSVLRRRGLRQPVASRHRRLLRLAVQSGQPLVDAMFAAGDAARLRPSVSARDVPGPCGESLAGAGGCSAAGPS